MTNDNFFFNFNNINNKKNNNDINECKLCAQINNLNVEHKKYLLDYLDKLNEFILKY